jgi:membrane protein DedA with SNARE-associated domain
MPDVLQFLDQLVSSNSPWIYAIIFAVAVLEGFVLTTFFVSGTIAIAATGALVARGLLSPSLAFLCVYLGTLLGDSISYLLSARIQHFPSVADKLRAYDHYRAPLARRPFAFTVLGHLTPYLKGVNAFLAGGVLPWRKWFLADAVGAFVGTLFLGSLGAAGARLLAAGSFNSVQLLVGVMALGLIILLWVKSSASYCRPRAAGSPSIFCPRHRHWKRVFFLLYFVPWHVVRKVESRLRKLKTRKLIKNLADEFPDVRAGDIFLVRLHSPAPWGKWAHSAIAVGNNRFCHGFGKVITAHRLEALPVRYAIAHLRVRCGNDVARRAAYAASEMIGRPVSIFARSGDTSRFSCASLISHAYATAGVALHDQRLPRVVPDDLFNSPLVDVVRVVFTEHTRRKSGRKEAPNAGCQRVAG